MDIITEVINRYRQRRKERLARYDETREFNEEDHNRSPNGQFTFKNSSEKKKTENRNRNVSRGFSRYSLQNHFKIHGDEPPFKGMNSDQFNQYAINELNKPLSDRVLGYDNEIFEDGKWKKISVRFDLDTLVFTKGYVGENIKTCFSPKYWNDSRDKTQGHAIYNSKEHRRKAISYYNKDKKSIDTLISEKLAR